ncbi:acetylcholinesterase [Halyomorpha halys]|uniref:acetylcholinesterase n=1 Tax=Halyomorpha halys TaxID=286706 RepID=UPI0006D4D58A|nr:acetylcholinesterase-like [Halyomorpha halys]
MLLLLTLLVSVEAIQEPVVTLRNGTVTGIKIYTDGRVPVLAFLGIPFAIAPVGERRFSIPESHPGWSGNLETKSFGPACIQPIKELHPRFGTSPPQDEDCLFLNVWTPEFQTTKGYRKAPVLVILEGEGFVSGYPGRIPAQDVAAEGIVVVSVSYRLNVFGFLCLENSEARGNLGLLDQYLGLLWVRQNIEFFGGDPLAVTLLGHSAGSVSALLHLISPRTSGLFHRAILMSGSALSPWSMSSHPSNSSYQIARSLGCIGKAKSVLACLKTKSSAELLKAFETQYMNGNWSDLPLPVVDDFLHEQDQYLPLHPISALKSGSLTKIPILTGITSHEGAVTMSQWNDLEQQGFSQLKHLFLSSIIPSVAKKYNFHNNSNFEEILTVLKGFYLDQVKDGDVNNLINTILNFYSDSQYKAPHMRQISYLAKKNKSPSIIYAYLFEQEVNHLYRHLNISGSGHGEDLLFLFGPSIINNIQRVRFTPAEERLGAIMKRFWIDFIRKGRISANPVAFGVSWTEYSPLDDNYIIFRADNNLPATQSVIRSPMPTLSKDATAKQIIWLWNELLPNLRDLRKNELGNCLDATEMQLTSDVPYRSAMYTLISFVVILLVLLIVCVVLLKKQATERERDMF